MLVPCVPRAVWWLCCTHGWKLGGSLPAPCCTPCLQPPRHHHFTPTTILPALPPAQDAGKAQPWGLGVPCRAGGSPRCAGTGPQPCTVLPCLAAGALPARCAVPAVIFIGCHGVYCWQHVALCLAGGQHRARRGCPRLALPPAPLPLWPGAGSGLGSALPAEDSHGSWRCCDTALAPRAVACRGAASLEMLLGCC